MSIYIDIKHLGFLSPHLRKFEKTDSFVWRFRCPFCGDSKRDENKARGYAFPHHKKRDTLAFKCHNCSKSTSLGVLIKTFDPDQYKEYRLEKFKENNSQERKPGYDNALPYQENRRKPKGRPEVLKNLFRISEMDPKSKPQHYVKKRRIPEKFHSQLYYARDFKEWLESVGSEQAKNVSTDDRLIIPFFDSKGENLIAVQGRSFNPRQKLRYITIRFDETPKIYGLDRHDPDAYTYILEGPIDSMFLPNAIATAGSDTAFMRYCDRLNSCYVPDNEPRNKEIVKFIDRIIEQGWSVCLWPKNARYKDVNDIVMRGKDCKRIVDNNTYSGLQAQAAFRKWRKV